MIDRSIERLLTETAQSLQYPPAPDLRSRVEGRVRGQPSERATGQLSWRPALVVIAMLLIAVAALIVTPSREAIGRFFGVQGSRIEVVPTAAPGETPAPTVPAGTYRGLQPVTIDEVRGLSALRVVEPRTSSPPRQAYVVSYAGQPVVVLSYESFDLWQTQLPQEALFGKMVEPDSILIETDVNGVPATWLSGSPHVVEFYLNPATRIPSSARIVERSTLIWRTDAAFYRIETDLPLEEAIRIAETLP